MFTGETKRGNTSNKVHVSVRGIQQTGKHRAVSKPPSYIHITVLLVTPHIHYCIQILASEQQDSLEEEEKSVHDR